MNGENNINNNQTTLTNTPQEQVEPTMNQQVVNTQTSAPSQVSKQPQAENNEQVMVTDDGQVINTVEEKKYVDMPLPELPKEQVIIETVKKKEKSNVPFIIVLVVIVFLAIYYMEDIIDFVDNTINNKNPSSVIETDDNNLVEGYILIDDNTGNIKVNSLKFYNFKKNSEELSIILNYVSSEKITNIKDEKIYIEFYNSNKEVLYKEVFEFDGILYANEIKTHSVKLNSDVFSDASYALVKTYNDSELNKEEKLVCEFKENTEEYNVLYKNTYTFRNELLVGYEVYKMYETIQDSTKETKYKKEIESEYKYIKENNIENTYENNTLTYKVDLQTDLNGFIPLYEKNTSITSIKNKDILKKWECE